MPKLPHTLSTRQAAGTLLVVYLLFLLTPVGLKLTGVFVAGWGWILVPLWGPWAFVLGFCLLVWGQWLATGNPPENKAAE